MSDEEIDAKVYARFPKIEMERKCATEKRLREAARNSYRQTLINELQTAQTILESMDAATDGN